ncbi:hypothetical protein SIAM614_28826 [Stappia aggregata IAM 12614]|uniref:DUF1254 domain-containing protein n=1 Tax=Roseibium aggregatum (strain ATCC 25650 / DSM 13394 / JCM 20685 / NBRC 16684 / NCIMB 2208 / IAM 12614 / B1) TaxID=384765 RepID=A0P4C7_ROSAI|nr:DUF1254 domain-containing protein [Roseibium aggregatum]EAV40116.1 hypothetical protein SIAM614_28826 [Stappia aggregata IAM 12614] [Roseibium aggregatum IAM 12614]
MIRLPAMSAIAFALAVGPALGQVSTAELDAISIPDKIETSIGTLEFFDGVPKDTTIAAVYDNLDRMRGMGVFLDNVGAVSMYSVRTGLADAGSKGANKIAIFEQLLDSQTLVVTANTSTLYAYTYTDLATDGPTVIEVPPAMLGFLDDAWQRFVGNMGVTGPDKGKGGKYLVVPPGYTDDIPDGYYLLKPSTNRNFMFLRGSIKNGLKPAVENITSKLKVYPLKDAENPAATEFVNMSNKPFNTVFPSDFSYFENLNEVIQEEPIDAISPEVRGAIASIGIIKGKPFAPDDRMKKLLTEAATLGDATSRVITYHPRIEGVRIYPDDPKSVWSTAFANKNTSFEADGIMGLDARVLYYFNAGGVTPAMAATRAGEGSDYGLAVLDSNQQPFDGSKTYRLHLPKDVPVNDFWAVTLYDTQTRSQLQTGQPFPTIGSQTDGMTRNADGSYDLYFAPEAPAGKEGNWLQTVPGKSWFTILRMYGPLEPWINKTWRPGEIDLVE